MLKNLIITLAAALTAVTAAAQAPADWANFGRFEKENAALADHPKVVLMGNSITEGWIAKRPDFFTENGYASRAISGQTTSQMLVRFRADVVELHPQVAVICGGTNDLAQNTGTFWTTFSRWPSWRAPTASGPSSARCSRPVTSPGVRVWNRRRRSSGSMR